jgi:hypothetical protein
LGTTVIDQNCIDEQIKNRTNSGNIWYNAVQKLLSFYLKHKNVNVKIHKTVSLPAVLYGYEAWFLTLRVEHRLRMPGNRVLMRIFGPNKNEVAEGWRKLCSY